MRGIEVSGQFGSGSPFDLNHRIPPSSQTCEDEALAINPFEADPRVPLVEQSHNLGVDPDEVADLGDDDRGE